MSAGTALLDEGIKHMIENSIIGENLKKQAAYLLDSNFINHQVNRLYGLHNS